MKMCKRILLLLVLVLSLGTKAQNINLEPKQDNKKPLWGYINPTTGKWVVKPTYNVAEPFKLDADGKFKALVTKGNLQGFIGADGKPLGAGIVFESMEPMMVGPNKIVAVKGKKGIIAPDASYIQKPEISEILPLDSEGYVVTVKGKKGFLSPEGITILAPVYDYIKSSEDNVFVVYKGGKAGLFSRQGEILFEPNTYNDVIKFGNFWKIKKGDKVGLFDPAKRRVVVSAEYADVLDPLNFREGIVYPVKKKNGKWGAVGIEGKEIISCKNQALTPLPSLNAIRVFRNNVGERLFLPSQNLYLELSSWNENQKGPFKVINFEVDYPSERTPDDKILGLSFAEHMNYDRNYRQRLAAYDNLGSKKSFKILIDKKGNDLGEETQMKPLGNYWVIFRKTRPWAVYDINGEHEIETSLIGQDVMSSPSGNWVSDGRYILFSDLNIYPIINCGENLRFIDQGNNSQWIPMVDDYLPNFNSSSYDAVTPLGSNQALVRKGEKWGLFSKSLILPCLYDSFREIDRNGWLEVKFNNIIGLYDPKFEYWIISPDNKIKSYEFYNSNNTSPILIYNGKWGLVNSDGQITLPMTLTKEEVLRKLKPGNSNSEPANKQSKKKKQQPAQEASPKPKKTSNTEFQESKEKRRF